MYNVRPLTLPSLQTSQQTFCPSRVARRHSGPERRSPVLGGPFPECTAPRYRGAEDRHPGYTEGRQGCRRREDALERMGAIPRMGALPHQPKEGEETDQVSVLRCLVFCCLILYCLMLSCLVFCCLILSCLLLSRFVLSCLMLSHFMLYHIVSSSVVYLALSSVVSSSVVYLTLSSVVSSSVVYLALSSVVSSSVVYLALSSVVSSCLAISVYARIRKLPVIFPPQLPMYVLCAAMRGAPQCAARRNARHSTPQCATRTSLIGTPLAKLSKQLPNITYRQLFNKHTIIVMLVYKNGCLLQ